MPANPSMPSVPTLIGAAVLAFVIFQVFRKSLKSGPASSSLNAIPSVGVPSGPFGFYIGAWNYIKSGRALTEEGFYKYPGKAFKVVFVDRWLVIVNGRALIEELAKAPDHLVSQSEGANSLLHVDHTLGREQQEDPYQVAVVRTALTRNIGICFTIIRSEVVAAFEDLIPAKTDEWTAVPAMPVATRTTSKLLQFAVGVMKDAMLLHIVPSFLRPLAARMFGHLDPATHKAMKQLGPILKHRLEMDDQYGPDWPDGERPIDLISWLLDEARGHPQRRTVRTLTRTVLNLNFAAIQSTTQAFLHAFYNLASNLEYVQPLRKEIESITKLEGWTKAAMGKMVKLDSFMKESARFVPGIAVTLLRQVVNDFTFCDGTTVPAGTLVGAPILAQHHNEANYTNGGAFDPFRFSRMREDAGEGVKHQMITPAHDYLSFGLGRHACPGRFFAANELKLIMAHLILTYDFKLKDGVRPEDEWEFVVGSANSTAEVMFRKRG
ncbi:cytochrome P450 [Mycena maculata]|uniref:Cytochrome P450 n=1 Tax=Mycena maculata TaxID=230809 RepID=A0AAD7NTB5_9AGAR|nr:cytochrome P450 [Mycena maculata]